MPTPTASLSDAPAPAPAPSFVDVYGELRRLSQARVGLQHDAVTLSATGLVHEAYLKLSNGGPDRWADRAHFLAVASRAMRQILTDRARARSAQKRGGQQSDLPLADAEPVEAEEGPAAWDQVLAVDAALDRLAGHDADLAALVELRFFGGLDVEEAAEALGISVRTAARRWGRAKAHLRALLG